MSRLPASGSRLWDSGSSLLVETIHPKPEARKAEAEGMGWLKSYF